MMDQLEDMCYVPLDEVTVKVVKDNGSVRF